MNPSYMYMWEFHVKERMVSAFEEVYGPKGDWVKLFMKGEGYLKTELHKDINNKGRYVTIDYWDSQESCMRFKKKYRDEFDKIDEKCGVLTLKEISLGSFSKIE